MTKKEVLGLSDYALDKVVKIQGTKFDRKRKISDNTISKIKYLRACGNSFSTIAKKLNVSYIAARYYTDEEFKNKLNHRPGSHANGNFTIKDRADYKRKLVSSNAHVIYPMD